MPIDSMWRYFLSPEFIRSAWMTLLTTLCSLLYGAMLDPVLALLQEAPFRAGKGSAFFYLWLSRGASALFQIIFVYNVLPGFDLRFFAFTCAVLALSLSGGAYMARILRFDLQAVGSGQRTAGMALGITHGQIMREIALPQAARIILPPVDNQIISMLKSSALVSVIAVQELLLVANRAASASFRYFEVLCAVGIYYLPLTSLFMIFQSWLEYMLDPRQCRSKNQKRLTRLFRLPKTVRGEP